MAETTTNGDLLTQIKEKLTDAGREASKTRLGFFKKLSLPTLWTCLIQSHLARRMKMEIGAWTWVMAAQDFWHAAQEDKEVCPLLETPV